MEMVKDLKKATVKWTETGRGVSKYQTINPGVVGREWVLNVAMGTEVRPSENFPEASRLVGKWIRREEVWAPKFLSNP